MKLIAKVLRCVAIFSLLACGITSDPTPPASGLLYVADRANKAIYVFAGVAQLDGGIDPVRTIRGDNTLIKNPSALAVDGQHDILYVAETSGEKVLAFPQASLANGDLAPLRTYPGLNRPAPSSWMLLTIGFTRETPSTAQ